MIKTLIKGIALRIRIRKAIDSYNNPAEVKALWKAHGMYAAENILKGSKCGRNARLAQYYLDHDVRVNKAAGRPDYHGRSRMRAA